VVCLILAGQLTAASAFQRQPPGQASADLCQKKWLFVVQIFSGVRYALELEAFCACAAFSFELRQKIRFLVAQIFPPEK
jgi:hypothetical protein